MWGATFRLPCDLLSLRLFQSTLPVWGATVNIDNFSGVLLISIHAPRVGSDLIRLRLMLYTISFQSTLPVWGATFVVRARHPTICDFNPRSPCGERPPPYAVCTFLPLFQSTLPVWGATHGTCYPVRHITNFNPRSPCGERLDMTKIARNIVYFNPRSPCGERLYPHDW